MPTLGFSSRQISTRVWLSVSLRAPTSVSACPPYATVLTARVLEPPPRYSDTPTSMSRDDPLAVGWLMVRVVPLLLPLRVASIVTAACASRGTAIARRPSPSTAARSADGQRCGRRVRQVSADCTDRTRTSFSRDFEIAADGSIREMYVGPFTQNPPRYRQAGAPF